MYDGLSAVDCLRKALANLHNLFETIGSRYESSLKKDKYVRENDVDVHETVNNILRERGFGVEGDDMDTSA
jgi:DNA-directed RNA polymerase I and III subunit RPAC2